MPGRATKVPTDGEVIEGESHRGRVIAHSGIAPVFKASGDTSISATSKGICALDTRRGGVPGSEIYRRVCGFTVFGASHVNRCDIEPRRVSKE